MMMKDRLNQLQQWWSQLAEREKRMVSVGGVIVTIFILYAGMWHPFLSHLQTMRNRIHADQQTLRWMQEADKSLQKLENQTEKKNQAISPVALLGLLQKQINEAGLATNLTGLKQSGNDAIEIQFQKVDFDKLMSFLLVVAKSYKVSFTQMNAIAMGAGLADVVIVVQAE
jgi:general secretion pathway protein M